MKNYLLRTFELKALILVFLFSCSEEELALEQVQDIESNAPCLAGEGEDCGNEDVDLGGGPDGGSTGSSGANSGLPNGRFQVFHRGRGQNSIYSSYSLNGQGLWNTSFELNSGAEIDDQSISSATFGNRVFVAHQGRTSNKIFYSSSTNGEFFTGDTSLPNARTTGNIKSIAFDGKLFIYHHGQYSNKIYYNMSTDGSSWVGHQVISDGTEYTAFDFEVFDNILYMFSIVREWNTMYSIWTNGFKISYSTDGINFAEIHTFAINPSTIFRNLSVAQVSGSFYILTEEGSLVDRTLRFGRWRPSVSNPTGGGSILNGFIEFDVTYESNAGFPPYNIVTTERARTDQPASLATDGVKLVITYEKVNGNNILYAYIDNVQGTSDFNIFRNWDGGFVSGLTKLSGIDVVYVP